ncbi:MAG: selenocysteine-specific translation elongation factor [Myxococcaceae bacterium]
MIVGTAGHVDHGKTTLVRALTGIDTDRLPEEKRRGITLELGFAHLSLPGGRTVGVVDVPGHERFVKAMAAGAGGVDLALLVVAADEGVSVQTREHVDICGLLGVRSGIIVVTKADLLPGLGEGWLELLETDLRALVSGTFLEEAPLVTVSAKSGAGLEELKKLIAKQADALAPRPSDGPAFLPVDRAFSLKGFGTVVTGTLLSGQLAVEEDVALLPGLEGPWRIRGIQVHGQAVKKVAAGERVALNLASVEAPQVSRGMAVTRAGELRPARVLDVELQLLPSVPEPLPRRSTQLVSIATAHVETQVRLLDVEQLRPGEKCFAQLRLSEPVAALPRQRFILRGSQKLEGRGATLAGGTVLALDPPRRKRGAGEKLKVFAEADEPAKLQWLLHEAGYRGLTEAELFAKSAMAPQKLARALENGGAQGRFVWVDKEARRLLDATVFAALSQRALALLDAFHGSNPEAAGLGREELRQRLAIPLEKTFGRLVQSLVDAKKVELDHELVRLPGRRRSFDSKGADEKGRLAALLESAALQPPLLAEAATQLRLGEARLQELLKVLVSEGAAVKAGDLWFHAGAIAALKAKLVAFLEANKEITTQQFKEMTGLTRKYLIPLAEYFDREKVTLRVGEKRILRKS